MYLSKVLFTIGCALVYLASASAQGHADKKEPSAIDSFNSDVEVSGLMFLAVEAVDNDDGTSSQFKVNRSYINIKKNLTKSISIRITPDVTVDKVGDGEGDVKLRLKYARVKAKLPDLAILTSPSVEFGITSRHILHFEQAINRYRVQGTMLLDRNKIMSTTGFGAAFTANFGGKMREEYRETVNSKHAGRYGTMAIGVYNGGGYHARENNENKTIEGRISIRPVPDVLPGLQFSYAGAYGKGNTSDQPNFSINSGYLTWESQRLRIVGQYYQGTGNIGGKPVDAMGVPEDYKAFAAFADINIPTTPLFVFGQYSQFESNTPKITALKKTVIAGIAYYFTKKSKILIDYHVDSFPDGVFGSNDEFVDIENDVKIKLSVELNY